MNMNNNYISQLTSRILYLAEYSAHLFNKTQQQQVVRMDMVTCVLLLFGSCNKNNQYFLQV